MKYELLMRKLELIVRRWPSGEDVIDNGGIEQLIEAVKECDQ